MTHRERMLAAIRGQRIDRLPWAPRLDLWYNANKRGGTLPLKYRNATLDDIIADLDAGFHAVVPDFRDLRTSADDIDRALGIYNLHAMPYRTVLENVRREVAADGDRTHVTYHTPAGSVTTTTVYDEAMRAAGITITHVEEHAFKSPADYAPLAHIFRNARVEANYGGYEEFAAFVGDRGVAVAYVNAAGSPMHLVQREVMPVDTFFYEMHDHPDEMSELAEAIASYWRQMTAAAAASPAEVLFLGANYDAVITYPPFFAKHMTPWLASFAGELHARGKYLLSHTDGENSGLLGEYLAASIDIADSVCPSPMTRLTLREVRDAFAGRITIMGGIPSVALLGESLGAREFDAFVDEFFTDLGRGDHLILGISDTTPPAADFARIVRIGEIARTFRV
jgi:hypothetical protein